MEYPHELFEDLKKEKITSWLHTSIITPCYTCNRTNITDV